MSNKQNDLLIVKNAIESGVNNVSIHKDELNNLNVFPIPDGDTGYNLQATLLSGWISIENSNYKSRKVMLNDFSEGLLFGARGNSGVVFTQIIRGLVKHIVKIPVKKEIKFDIFYSALVKSKKYAYKSINKPVEGTMLTVISDIVNEAPKKIKHYKNYIEAIREIVNIADKSVKNTPNLLPILKESNVVDSGAKGLYYFLEGILLSAEGKPVKLNKKREALVVEHKNTANELNYNLTMLGYCTEFIIQVKPKMDIKKTLKIITRELEKPVYNSFVILNEKKHVKVHVHTFKPHKVIQLAHKCGEFIKIKIDNMTLQNQHVQEFKSEHMGELDESKTSVIAFINGNHWANIIKKSGVSEVIVYNNNSVPSVKSIVDYIKRVLTKNIILLSNNSNLNMTIDEAIKMLQMYNIYLCKSLNNGEVYAAANYYNNELSFNDQKDIFEECIENSLVINISKSSKKYANNEVKVNKNDYISTIKNKISQTSSDLEKCFIKTFEKQNIDNYDLTTIFYGKNVSRNDAEIISKKLEEKYDLDIKLIKGGQEIYLYTIILE